MRNTGGIFRVQYRVRRGSGGGKEGVRRGFFLLSSQVEVFGFGGGLESVEFGSGSVEVGCVGWFGGYASGEDFDTRGPFASQWRRSVGIESVDKTCVVEGWLVGLR